jgi:hypothetical protein
VATVGHYEGNDTTDPGDSGEGQLGDVDRSGSRPVDVDDVRQPPIGQQRNADTVHDGQ